MSIENMGKVLGEVREAFKKDSEKKVEIAKKIYVDIITGLEERILKEEIFHKNFANVHEILYKKLELNPIASKLASENVSTKAQIKLQNAIMEYITAYSGKIGYQRMRGENNE